VKQILGYLQSFLVQQVSVKKTVAYFCFMGLACWLNYFSAVKNWQKEISTGNCFFIYTAIFLACLLFGFLIELRGIKKIITSSCLFVIVIAAVLFAIKITFPSYTIFSNFLPAAIVKQWNLPLYWAGNLFVIVSSIIIIYRLLEKKWGLYGFIKTTSLWPYFLMLLIMTPVIWIAAQQNEFQLVYPKAKSLGINAGVLQFILFQISYIADFFTIELFFRGFLILVLSKYAGIKCILPVALFYFTIHLGKPMAEAISSFFGGTLLGVISYHTKSIWGGWVVHAGIALLMELFGFLL
jgi:membrane protease YdiL (CAAX protease family)